jgi:hypothetical protein
MRSQKKNNKYLKKKSIKKGGSWIDNPNGYSECNPKTVDCFNRSGISQMGVNPQDLPPTVSEMAFNNRYCWHGNGIAGSGVPYGIPRQLDSGNSGNNYMIGTCPTVQDIAEAKASDQVWPRSEQSGGNKKNKKSNKNSKRKNNINQKTSKKNNQMKKKKNKTGGSCFRNCDSRFLNRRTTGSDIVSGNAGFFKNLAAPQIAGRAEISGYNACFPPTLSQQLTCM